MASFKLVTYEAPQGAKAGILCGDQVFDAAAATGAQKYGSIIGILADWDKAKPTLSRIAAEIGKAKGAMPLAGVTLAAPIPNPGTIYCAGANYRDHVLEMAKAQNIEPEPDPHSLGLNSWHFIKSSHCVVGPDATVRLPPSAKKVDWEAELGAVIGRMASHVPVERALDYVAGYTIGNDLSARDVMRREPVPKTSPFHFDWVAQKCFDGACPLGPWITLTEDIPDPQNLKIELKVNGAVKQSSNTGQMIFSAAEQIAHLSARITLHPGDIVLTGTPSGVGMSSQTFLKGGDEVRITIERIGELVTRFA
jgi:2-keto-4-pentenoate hydratase/2-oxohepta-3-ene-1,7-dioic acid hydratase in catechol pathway